MGLARADWPILYGKTMVTADDIGRAERYYLTLFNAPGAVSALLHAMVGQHERRIESSDKLTAL
jgi:hypothetical protein